jgi:hypothetical protein
MISATFRKPLRIGSTILILALVLVSTGLVYADRIGSSKEPSSEPTALVVEDLTGPLTATDLAEALAGVGVTVSNVTYVGADEAAGGFSGGTGIIGFEAGIILGSGSAVDVVGPNTEDSVTTNNQTPGDSDLDALSGFVTLDASVLEFDFIPDGAQIFFDFVFASDEYNEFVNSQFNDVFAFYINDFNCATVGVNDDPITINTINNGNPYDSDPRSNPELYRNNDLDDGGGSIDTEMDGLTVVLTCGSLVDVGVTNHMKLAIADASDSSYDSNVFIKAGSLTTVPTSVSLSSLDADTGNRMVVISGGLALLLLAAIAGRFVIRRRPA